MSPARGAGGDDHYADRNRPGRGSAPAAAALGADNDEVRGTPDVFDGPVDDLKAKLSGMTKELGSLIDRDDDAAAPETPVAEQADIDVAPPRSSGMARLAGRTDEAPEPADEPASAADRVALALSIDDDDVDDVDAPVDAPDPTAEALEAPDLLGQEVLRANFDGDLNDNNILDRFEDDLPADDDPGDDDGGLEFASLDFDGD